MHEQVYRRWVFSVGVRKRGRVVANQSAHVRHRLDGSLEDVVRGFAVGDQGVVFAELGEKLEWYLNEV